MTGFTPASALCAPRPTAPQCRADLADMQFPVRLVQALRLHDDELADHRHRVARILSILAPLLLMPFSLNHLLGGRPLLGSMILAAQLVMAANAWGMRGGKSAPLPFWLLILGFILAVCEAILRLGLVGALWAYPAALVSYSVLHRRVALMFSLLLLVLSTTLVWHQLGPAVAARFGGTLAMTLVMTNVALNVLAQLQRALVQQTLTDPLTGAYNRRHLAQQLDQLARPGAEVYCMNALLAIDIDHFKTINDRHGHAVGDTVLVACVQALSSRKRQSDMLFRTGGEEFVLLLPRTSAQDAQRVAESLRARIAEADLLPGHPVTVSIGVGVQQPHHSADDWLNAADRALYGAKNSGRNRVEMSA